jgi:tetratricopeptide (TPR) repeat protein
VFWVHSSNAIRFEQAYQEIASEAVIPGWNDPKTNILQLVNKWLCDKNRNWLIVLDNADDNNVFFDAFGGNKPLADYLPQTSNGSILITSRNKMAAQNLVGSYGNIIAVEPMSTDDAVTLLQTHIKVDQSSKNTARALVEALECIPLAIAQAGAYISHRSPRITVSIYLELFRQSKSNQEKLMNYKGNEDIRRDKSIRDPVITTWQISFDQICRTTPVATDLLSLMSMFDRQGIPEDLINQGMDQLDFEDAIASLTSFSLIRAEIGEQSFEMHQLVQLSIRQWLKQHGQFYKWVQQGQQVMGQAFPTGDYGTWKTCQILLPHLKEMIQLIMISDNDDPPNMIGIANRCGWYLFLQGKYKEAEEMYRQALQGSKKVLGAEHPDMLKSINYLGNVLDSQGKYEEAEAMHRQAREGYEKVLGAEHPDTLRSVNSLANVLTKQGKLEDAKAMHQQALAAREKLLGTEHPDTLRSVNNLGCVLRSQGKYEEAEAMYRRALTAREKVLGDEHPDTLNSVYSLANVLYSQGEHEKAEAVHRRALKGHEKVLGAEHPYTLNSINNLGNVLYSQGEYKEAEAMYRQALIARKKVLGAEHPDTLSSIYSLDHVLYSQGKHKEDGAIHGEALT